MSAPSGRPGRMARPKPLAEYVEPCIGRAIAAQGFTGADIVVSWPDIVGERLGAVSQPIKVEWPRRPKSEHDAPPQPATLVVRVEGAFALEMQHLAPLLMERVNAVYGWRCIGRIVLKQGPVRRNAPPSPERHIGEAESRRVADATAPVADDPLRAALQRLGTAVLSTDGPT